MAAPKRFPDRDEIAAVRDEAEPSSRADGSPRSGGSPAACMARRGHGKLVFLDLVDRSGRIQLLCDASRTGDVDVDLGDVVGVVGSPA